MSSNHEAFHFSIKVPASDNAVLHCLRALNQWAQLGAGYPLSIGWGGTGKRKRTPAIGGWGRSALLRQIVARLGRERRRNFFLDYGKASLLETMIQPSESDS